MNASVIIALIVLLGWFCKGVFNYYEYDEKAPITVRDLVDAAIAGKWMKPYQEQESRQP